MQFIDEDTEVSLRAKIPKWIETVEHAKKEKVDYITTMLDALSDDPKLLFHTIWYAYSHGVDVLIISPHEKEKRNDPPRTITFLRDPRNN